MAVNKAVEARKKAKAKREERLAKSKGKKGFFRKAFEQVSGDIKKAAKGSKEYQAGQAKKKAAKVVKAEKQAPKIKALAAKRKAQKAERAKTAGPVFKAGKDYSKAGAPKKAEPKKAEPKKEVAPQKFGSAFSSARKAGKKTFTWKGKSYTTKTADDVKKAASKKAASKKVVSKSKTKVKAPSGPEGPGNDPRYDPKPGQKSTMMRNRPERKNLRKKYPPATEESRPPLKFKNMEEGGMVDTYEGGGKVDSSGLFNFPSTDARKRGK